MPCLCIFAKIFFMEEGIGAIVLLVIIILCIPIFITVRISNKLENINQELFNIKKLIADLKLKSQQDNIKNTSTVVQAAKAATPVYVAPIIMQQAPEPEIKKPIYEAPKAAPAEVVALEPVIVETPINIETPAVAIQPIAPKPIEPIEEVIVNIEQPPIDKPVYTSEIKNKSAFNLEQFIGEKLISIVGIAILVLGIFFSVKWAIDKELISNTGKVMIGLISGTILIGVAHRLIKNYRAFSSILVGGGLAVFYFSIYSAFQTYHIIGQVAAFAIMIAITILGAILAIIYDKKELAIIAMLGGFCTPFFLSTGAGNFKILFTYMAILNLGMFALAFKKNWRLLNTIAYVATYIIFLSWLATKYDNTNAQSAWAFGFATIFYLIFFGANIIYNIKHGTKIAAQEVTLLLSNACIYFGVGMWCLHSFEPQNYKGIFTICLATLNFVFAYIFYKNNKIDKNIIYLLIGLVLTFVSITGPIQLHGNYITLFWASEIIILYVIGNKTKLSVLKNASVGILAVAIISLMMDWNNNYYALQVNFMPIILNKAFITSLVVLAAIFIKQKLVRQDSESHLMYGSLPTPFYANLLTIILIVLSNIAGLMELKYQSHHLLHGSPLCNVLCWTYEYIFMAILCTYVIIKNKTNAIVPVVISSSILLLLYPFANYAISNLHTVYLLGYNVSGSLFMYMLLPITALYLLFTVLKYAIPTYSNNASLFKVILWLSTIIGLVIISTWSVHLWTQVNYSKGFDINAISKKGTKVVLPILWSVASLILMLQGMRHKLSLLRVIALSLFALTILKLFVYDISNMGQGAKIAAFVILGVILLLVSFMYQKIKNLFTDNTPENNA
jgi:uncharacterized membrane protein